MSAALVKLAVAAGSCLGLLGACSVETPDAQQLELANAGNSAASMTSQAGSSGSVAGIEDRGQAGVGGDGSEVTGSSAGADSSGGTANAGGAAANGGDDVSAAGMTSEPEPEISEWPEVLDYGARGGFTTQRDNDVGPDASFDVFRPTELLALGLKHPIVSWANGTLFGIPEYANLLEHWASHGFVVIASHSQSTGNGLTHQAGVQWLVQQNTAVNSPYFGALDLARVGAAGHSQGAGATIIAGSDALGPSRIVTTLAMMPIPNFIADLTVIGRQQVPMLVIAATLEDRDPTFAARIFDETNGELVEATFIGVHEDAMNSAMAAPTLAWFRFRLMNDEEAGGYFYPAETCLLCVDPAWESVRLKNTP